MNFLTIVRAAARGRVQARFVDAGAQIPAGIFFQRPASTDRLAGRARATSSTRSCLVAAVRVCGPFGAARV